jgi:hypothetical protein
VGLYVDAGLGTTWTLKKVRGILHEPTLVEPSQSLNDTVCRFGEDVGAGPIIPSVVAFHGTPPVNIYYFHHPSA